MVGEEAAGPGGGSLARSWGSRQFKVRARGGALLRGSSWQRSWVKGMLSVRSFASFTLPRLSCTCTMNHVGLLKVTNRAQCASFHSCGRIQFSLPRLVLQIDNRVLCRTWRSHMHYGPQLGFCARSFSGLREMAVCVSGVVLLM